MPIPTTYTELKTEIANWLKRDDLTNDIPTMIAIAEQKINNDSNIRPSEASTTVTTTSGQNYTTLPSGFKDIISLIYTNSEYENPTKATLSDIDNYRNANVTGIPSFYAISDSNFEWDLKASGSYSLSVRYYKKWDIATDSTNSLLTNNFAIYLYGALAESGVFLRHPQLSVWQKEYKDALSHLEYNTSKVSKSPLGVDPGVRNYRSGFDINKGY